MYNIIAISIKDMISKEVGWILLGLVLISSVIVWGIGGYFIYDSVGAVMSTVGAEQEEGWIKTISLAIGGLFGWFVSGYLVYILTILIAGLLTPKFIKIISEKRNIVFEEKGFNSLSSGVIYLLKMLILQIIILILLLPTIFIGLYPFVILISMYYMFYKTLSYDVLSNVFNKSEYKTHKDENANKIRGLSMVGYISSFVPIVGIFGGVFTVIMLINDSLLDSKNN